MDRVSRFINNSKQNKIRVSKAQPSLQSMREGEEVLYMSPSKSLMRYRKENGILWSSQMSRNGDYSFDGDIKIKGDIAVYGMPRMANLPVFEAYMDTTQSNMPLTNTLIEFDGTNMDNTGGFDTSTHLYTVPISGIYLLYYNLCFTAFDTGMTYAKVNFKASQSGYFGICRIDDKEFTSDTAYVQKSLTVTKRLIAGETLGLYYYQTGGTAQTDIALSSGSSLESVFGGYLISK